MNLRVVIFGAGRMGRERARAARLAGARVALVSDPDVERAAALAAEFGAALVSNPDDVDLKTFDAVFVCTPPAFRGQTEMAAVEAGVPLFVEKPVGLNAAQCLDLHGAIKRRGIINAVGYMNRYRESVLTARRLLEGATPIGVAFQWFATRYRVPWWLDRDLSGGPINEQCTHFIDLCRFLVGEIVEVHAIARALPDAPSAEGSAAISLRFENGQLGTGLYSCEAAQKQIALEVFLPDRSIRLQGWDLRLDSVTAAEDIFAKEVDVFFRAIQTGDPSMVHSDFESAMKTQRVIDEIRGLAASPERVEAYA